MKALVRTLLALILTACSRAEPASTVALGAAAIGGSTALFYGCQQCPANGPCPPGATGGRSGAGGGPSTGGSVATGGNVATGGARATGGRGATGGGISTGGATAQSIDLQACNVLHDLGCPEGTDPVQCADKSDPTSMSARCKSKKVKCNSACIIAATSKSDIQTKCHIACGSL
jgi:hypothetical protein